MNVLNRKMFSNRDARKKLAGMGGILASSPELMGTAQRFQEGGQGNAEQEFIVNIPGFSAPGEMLRITESTLAQLTELIPELLSQKDTLVAPVELLANVKSRPGDAVVSTRLRRMFEAPAERTSVSENLTLDSQSMANRAAAASLLGQQLSGLTLMPERTPGELEVVVEGEDQRAAEAATRRRIADEDMAMARPVPRNDFRTFPVEMPSEGKAQPAAPVRTQTAADIANETALRNREMASENAGRLTAEELMSPDVSFKPEDLAASRLAASAGFVGEDEPTITDYSTLNNPDLEKLLSLNPRNPDPALLDEILSRSTPRTEALDGIDSDAGAALAPDMVAQLNRLAKLRTARNISENSRPVANFLEGANLVGGAAADTALALSQLGQSGLGYLSGGGGISDFFFRGSEKAKGLREGLRDDGQNFAPRIYNPETEEDQAEAERAAIEQDSLRSYADAILRGDDVLFSDPLTGQGAADRLPQESVGESLISANDQAAAEEFSQRPDTQDPLTDARLVDIVMSAVGEQPTTVVEQPAVGDQTETVGSGFSLAPDPDSSLGRLIEQGKQLGQNISDSELVNTISDAVTGTFGRAEEALTGPQVQQTGDLIIGDPEADASVNQEPTTALTTPDAETDPVVETKPAKPLDPTTVIPSGSADDLANEVKKDPENANKVVSDAILDGAGVDTTGMDLKERTVAMRKVLSDLMGDTPEDEKNEFWMNMAMMGFAVAAGESPDALKNIADGMLAGTAQIQQGKAAKKERQDKMTLTAFGEVLADQRATDKFGRDLAVAKVRAAGTDNKYNAARERSRLKEQIIKSPFDYANLLDDSGTLDPKKLNEYLDLVVNADAETETEIIVTEDQARAEFEKIVKQRPELREAMLNRMKNQGFSIEGL